MKQGRKSARRGEKTRTQIPDAPGLDPLMAQHAALAAREIMTDQGIARVIVNDSDSPLAWLARRKGRDGRAMIDHNQFVASEQ